jgi:hypothetical protein
VGACGRAERIIAMINHAVVLVGGGPTGLMSAPTAVLIRPDGYVVWVGERTQAGLTDALHTWFGPPAAT